MDTINMLTDYEIIQPNYYSIYIDIIYHCLPNATDIFAYLHRIFYVDPTYLTPEYCEHIQDSIFQ